MANVKATSTAYKRVYRQKVKWEELSFDQTEELLTEAAAKATAKQLPAVLSAIEQIYQAKGTYGATIKALRTIKNRAMALPPELTPKAVRPVKPYMAAALHELGFPADYSPPTKRGTPIGQFNNFKNRTTGVVVKAAKAQVRNLSIREVEVPVWFCIPAGAGEYYAFSQTEFNRLFEPAKELDNVSL